MCEIKEVNKEEVTKKKIMKNDRRKVIDGCNEKKKGGHIRFGIY